MSGLTIYCGECECEHDEPVCPPIPRCEWCHKAFKKRELRTYRGRDFDRKFQAALHLCRDCYIKHL